MRISDWSSDVCSSDLDHDAGRCHGGACHAGLGHMGLHHGLWRWWERFRLRLWQALPGGDHRSEEHTYELQSLMRNSYAVFCLKKKHSEMYGSQEKPTELQVRISTSAEVSTVKHDHHSNDMRTVRSY